jgi:hypothetical protein
MLYCDKISKYIKKKFFDQHKSQNINYFLETK